MREISDPAKAGRGDRRRAQTLIDAAYAAGRLTAADRSFRTDRVDAAYTKGDLATIVRDLERDDAPPVAPAAAGVAADPDTAAAPSLGSAIPPDELKAMSAGATISAGEVGQSLRTAMSGSGVKTARRVVLIFVVGFFLLCGLGVAAFAFVIFRQVSDTVDSARPGGLADRTPVVKVNLHTAEGWTDMVDAVGVETGSTRVYDAVVYPEYASINSVADEGAMRFVYRDGTFMDTNFPVTPALGDTVDLADIDADMIARLPARTAKRQDMREFESAYFIVNALFDEPKVTVYLQQSGKLARWTVFDLDGKVIGGTPR